MTIRILTKNDGAAYRQIRLRSLKEDPMAFCQSYADEATKSAEIFGQAIHPVGEPIETFSVGAFSTEDNLIGVATLKRDQREVGRHKALLTSMYVVAEARSMGVGQQIIDFIIKYCKQIEDLEQIYLWVLHHQKESPAKQFYQKKGFQSVGLMVKNDLKINGQYVDAEYMINYLNP